MNDRALRYFLAIVRSGSVRAAAETLNIAASAISRQIIEMEAEFGQPLLERLPRGMVPTEAGKVVAEYALRQADDRIVLEDRLRRLRGLQQGTVKLWCGGGFITDFVERGLVEFAENYAGINYQVSLATTAEILIAVAQGDADIGIAYDAPSHPDVCSFVSARQPVFAVLCSSHPMARIAKPTPLSAFANEPAVLLPPDHGVRQILGRVEAEGNFRLTARVESSSFDLHRRFIASGLGIGFLPRFVVHAEVRAGEFRLVALQDAPLIEVRSHLLLRNGRNLTEAARRLASHLAKTMITFRTDIQD